MPAVHKNDAFYTALERFLPTGTADLFPPLLEGHSVLVKVTKARISKFGDYRPLHNKPHLHQITVNNDLNPYAFLVTFLHEIAHMYTYEIHKSRVKPHGAEWKDNYVKILTPFIHRDYLPTDVYNSLREHINGPTASSCSDHKLFQALKKYNPQSHKKTVVESIPMGGHFLWRNGQVFQKTGILRKRFKCIDMETRRVWFFHPMAEVERFEM